MQCECLKRVEGQIAEIMADKAGLGAEVRAMNIALCIPDDGAVYSALQIPFRIKGTGKGFTSAKGKEMGCNVSCCPFCGKRVNQPEGHYDGLEQV